jgi:hypothetical protein
MSVFSINTLETTALSRCFVQQGNKIPTRRDRKNRSRSDEAEEAEADEVDEVDEGDSM